MKKLTSHFVIKLLLSGLFLFDFSSANADLTTGLVAHWSFDDCSAKDNSGNGHDGTLNGNPQCVDGVKGKAFSFDGIKDFIQVADTSELRLSEISYTLSGWVKLKTYNSSYRSSIISKGGDENHNGYILALTGLNGSPEMFISGGTNPLAIAVSNNTELGKWRSITVSYDANIVGYEPMTKIVKLYVDGTLAGEFPDFPIPNSDTNVPLIIAKDNTDNYFLNGDLDDLRLYNRALTEAEVMELSNGTPTYTLHQPLDNLSASQMKGTVLGQCVYGGYCNGTSTKTAYNGVNYTTNVGSPVYAVCDGTVKKAQRADRFMVIDHSSCGGFDSLFAYYSNIDLGIFNAGSTVNAGDQIGTVAKSKNGGALHLSFNTSYVTSSLAYTPIGKTTLKDCTQESVTQRRTALDAKGYLDPILVGSQSGWNPVLLKGGDVKTGCEAPEQLFTDQTLPYSPWN